MMETSVEKEVSAESCASEIDVMDITGGDGLWQRCIFVMVFLLQIITALHLFSMVFLAPNLDHWCTRPHEATNLSVEQWRYLAMPHEDQQCSRYKDINFTIALLNRSASNDTIPCEAWEYDNTIYSSTVLSQFDLVCDRKWMVSLAKSAYFFAASPGFFVLSHVSDWKGRKSVIIISGFITVCAGTLLAFSISFTMFLILRCFVAIGAAVNNTTSFVYLMEVVSPKYRNTYGISIGLATSLGIIILPLLAWLIGDWFWIQMALNAYSLVFLAAFWMPESPRWLLNRGKVQEAESLIFKAAKINGVNISDEDKTVFKGILIEKRKKSKSVSQNVNILDLLKRPGLRKITLIFCDLWFVTAFIYHGLSQNTNELAGNPFVNFALYGVFEIPAYIFVIFTVEKLGKRNLIIWSMFSSGIACFISYLLPSEPWWLNVSATMIGKFAITISFGILYIYSSELFPTVARNTGMGFAQLFGRTATTAAPFMRELGDVTHPIFPQLIFGVLSIASGLLIFLLPDTRKCIMPDTLEESEEFLKTQQSKKKRLNSL